MISKFIIFEKIYLPIFYIIGAFIIYFILSGIVNKVLVINKTRKNKSNV